MPAQSTHFRKINHYYIDIQIHYVVFGIIEFMDSSIARRAFGCGAKARSTNGNPTTLPLPLPTARRIKYHVIMWGAPGWCPYVTGLQPSLTDN